MDMVAAAEAMDALQWQPEEVVARELLAQQPVVLNPQPAAA
jgi:hypothetical protein